MINILSKNKEDIKKMEKIKEILVSHVKNGEIKVNKGDGILNPLGQVVSIEIGELSIFPRGKTKKQISDVKEGLTC